MAWALGQKLQGGKYTIEQKLGQGGFGITYLATDNKKGNQVVIKTLKNADIDSWDSDKYLQDFVNEAIKLAKCNHPHIVQVYEVIKEDDDWGMVMEYVEGKDLHSHDLPLPESDALVYICHIGEALTVVHKNGFLHRDVKPRNIVVREDKTEAVLIDFGIARDFIPDATQTHTTHRTDFYAPPEQYNRRAKRGAYTDVYGLAATLYKLLTGQEPESAMSRVLGEPLKPPKELVPNISDKVNQAILQGMELFAETRPQTVQEWLSVLPATKASQVSSFPQESSVGNVSSSPQEPSKIDDLIYELGTDYTYLKELLEIEEWEDAEIVTANIMLKAVNIKYGELSKEQIEKFPCKDLQIIDQLWLKYSNGRFGFSVQKRIYQEERKNYLRFAKRVGWLYEDGWIPSYKLSYLANAPEGHLPVVFGRGQLRGSANKNYGYEERRFLFSRMEICKL